MCLMTIVFISTAPEKPSGGVKVIYQFCEDLIKKGFKSEILHTDNLMGSCDWLSYDVSYRRHLSVDNKTDFVVIPEGAAGFFGKVCIQLGIKYCILVQNGYQIYNVVEQSTRDELDEIYQKSSLILSISDDTTNIIKYIHKDLDQQKILRVYPKINRTIFYKGNKKTNAILYMPRRLGLHSYTLNYFLEKNIPSNWTMSPVDNMSENEVGEQLRSSSIFLSFSDLEGFGLPPLEAALCGNIVIGYSGQGGNEYFNNSIFRKVEYGNFLQYSECVLNAIDTLERGYFSSMEYLENLTKLSLQYSDESYEKSLIEFAKKVNALF